MTKTAVLGVLLLVGMLCHGTVRAAAPTSQTPPYLSSLYVGGSFARQVSIKTRAGETLTMLDVPAGIELSIHLVKGTSAPDDKGGYNTFTGDVVIRTLPTSQIGSGGSALTVMMGAPLRLEVQDAVVTLTRK